VSWSPQACVWPEWPGASSRGNRRQLPSESLKRSRGQAGS